VIVALIANVVGTVGGSNAVKGLACALASLILLAVLQTIWVPKPRYGFGWWVLSSAVLIAVCGLAPWRLLVILERRGPGNCDYHLLLLDLVVLVSTLIYLLLRKYAKQRPGTSDFATAAGAILGAAGGYYFFTASGPVGAAASALRAIEFNFAALTICWSLFIACGFLASLIGVLLSRSCAGSDDAAERDRTRRAIRTARVCLALPAVLVFLLELVLWSSLLNLARGLERALPQARTAQTAAPALPASATQPVILPPRLVDLPDGDKRSIEDDPSPSRRFCYTLIATAATPLFLVALSLIMLSALVFAWALWPAVWAEVRPPDPRRPCQKRARLLGQWLSHGHRALGISALGLFLTAFVILPAGFILDLSIDEQNLQRQTWLQQTRLYKWWSDFPGRLKFIALPASMIAVLAAAGRSKWLALGFRPVVDVALDVDNYLREHPWETNPRALICARYTSLLRHLHRPDAAGPGRPYDAIVIVAHSQGSVITAELLRFIVRHPDPALNGNEFGKSIPLSLLTIGCPLRQLYGRRFPHLYAWARHDDAGPWDADDPCRNIPGDQLPNPVTLQLQRWTNLFCSGDYVGRYLWRPDKCEFQWDSPVRLDDGRYANISEDRSGLRREFCVGEGAHTRYLTSSVPYVADELDRLIRQATDSAPPAGQAKGVHATPA
jgi:hypothetical protein